MLIPASHYGSARAVKTQAKRIARGLVAGGDWNDLCGNELVDTRERDGLIFLDPGHEDTGQTAHFFIYLPLETAFTALNERATLAARIEPLIEAALTTAWGTLAVLAVGTPALALRRKLFAPFVKAVVRHWPELEAEGARFTDSDQGTELWNLNLAIKFVLANSGVPVSALQATLPKGGLSELVKQAVLP